MASATILSSSSPTAWPWRSLTSFSLSTSIASTAKERRPRRSRTSCSRPSPVGEAGQGVGDGGSFCSAVRERVAERQLKNLSDVCAPRELLCRDRFSAGCESQHTVEIATAENGHPCAVGQSGSVDRLPHRWSQLVEDERASRGLARAYGLEQQRMLVERPTLAVADATRVELRVNADVFTLEAVEASAPRRCPQWGCDPGSQTARDNHDLVGIPTRVQLARSGTEQLSLTQRLLALGDRADEAATQGVRRRHHHGAEHPPQNRPAARSPTPDRA